MRPVFKLCLPSLLLTGAVGSAQAATCHDTAISARGEPARFEWIAKTKARANWRRKVRATTGLGTEWAVWGQAANTEEYCAEGPSSVLCTFTGTPCKP